MDPKNRHLFSDFSETKEDSDVCGGCGERTDGPPGEDPGIPEPVKCPGQHVPGTWGCPHCGTAFEFIPIKCLECGYNLHQKAR